MSKIAKYLVMTSSSYEFVEMTIEELNKMNTRKGTNSIDKIKRIDKRDYTDIFIDKLLNIMNVQENEKLNITIYYDQILMHSPRLESFSVSDTVEKIKKEIYEMGLFEPTILKYLQRFGNVKFKENKRFVRGLRSNERYEYIFSTPSNASKQFYMEIKTREK